MRKASIHIICFVFTSITALTNSFSQKSNLPFQKIDSFAIAVRYQGNYIKLANDLTTPFYKDEEKLRAIYKWVISNIAYDYRFINSEREITVPDCADKINCADIIRSWENNFVKRVLQRRKATDYGYSLLISKLCEISHIQEELINGYLKNKPYQTGNKISANHYWNAVLIDTSWLFIDATCGAGYCTESETTGKLTRFIKDNNDYYFLLPFFKLSRNHFPKNEIWGQADHMTSEYFFKKPHYYSVDILDNISNEFPNNGILSAKKGDTLRFRFNFKKPIKTIQINSNTFRNPSIYTTVIINGKSKIIKDSWAEKKQVFIPYQKNGNEYSFNYPVTDNSLYYIEVVLDNKQAIRYKVKNSK